MNRAVLRRLGRLEASARPANAIVLVVPASSGDEIMDQRAVKIAAGDA